VQLDSANIPFVLGIDLGTTNSLVAAAKIDRAVRVLLLEDSTQHDPVAKSSSAIQVQILSLPQDNSDGTISEDQFFPSVVFQAEATSPPLVGRGARDAKYQSSRGRHVFYSVKKDLGTDREPFYAQAITADLDTPVKVTATILRTIKHAAEQKLATKLDSVPMVITIPASFQSAQRRDTLTAAQQAGLQVDDKCLFDEPNAALLGYINRQKVRVHWHTEETVLIFDFGGGTCDISIIGVSVSPVSKKISLRNLAISRYEQLGGDDIDQHYVHTILAQTFYEHSGITERDWSFAERRNSIWSQLSKIAETLKIRLCEELDKVVQGSGWNISRINQVHVTLPPQDIHTSRETITLSDLTLNYKTFQDLITPFLDPDGIQNADKEYYQITSVFTPIQDALDKANLKRRDITRVLLVGGSSRNPFVERAIQEYFQNATIDRPFDLDTLVAEGAAVQAYAQFVQGHDVLTPIVGDTIGLLTEGNVMVPLIQAGSSIPYPDHNEWLTYTHFQVPHDLMAYVDLVICAGAVDRPVHKIRLTFPTMVPRATPVHLKVRLDHSKILHLEAYLPDYADAHVSVSIDNPFTITPMTSIQQERINLENKVAKARKANTLPQYTKELKRLAEVTYELDHYEASLEWSKAAVKYGDRNDVSLKNLQALALDNLGESEKAFAIWSDLADKHRANWVISFNAGQSAPDLPRREQYLRQAVSAAPGNGIPLLALAMALQDKGEHTEAKTYLDRARALLESEQRAGSASPGTLSWLALAYDYSGERAKAQSLRHQIRNTNVEQVQPVSDALVGISTALAPRNEG
jgi:molecular chaperone DnaK (HSP70)